MTKWITLYLFFFSVCLYMPRDAYARGYHSRSHGHSHGRTPTMHRLKPYKNSKPTESRSRYTYPIYQSKKQSLPRIYTLERPLIDDAGIYRPLNISSKYQLDFYRYDHKKDQYSTPSLLHADTRAASIRRSLAIEINGEIFYYNDGFFYKESGEHLIVVPPVINSFVQKIPKGSSNVGITGSHYEYNGIYFKRVSQGYQVVGLPVMI